MLAVSHSQSDAFAKCEYSYTLAHVERLDTILPKVAPWRGTVGHVFFEEFLGAIKNGHDAQTAKNIGLKMMMQKDSHVAIENMPLVIDWVENVWPGLNWEVLEIETTHRI